MSELIANWLKFLQPTTGNDDMGRFAKEGEGREFQDPTVGTHVARCVRIIDLGTQHDEYQGKKKVRHKIVLQWELCEEFMDADDDGVQKPFVVTKFYTYDIHEKAALGADLINWRGRPFTSEERGSFDMETILGAPCIISIKKNEAGKPKVDGVAKLVKGMQAPAVFNKPGAFWMDPWDQQAFEALSDGYKRMVTESDEYKAMKAPPALRQQAKQVVTADGFEDDIPF